MNIKQYAEKLRLWIDGDGDLKESDKFFDQIKEQKKSESEQFLQRLLAEIEKILIDEVVRVPNTKKAYVPSLFVVFISEADEKLLPKRKREFFEETLCALVTERAKESAGNLELSAKQIQVEIRINGTLEKGEIDVQAFDEAKQKSADFCNSLNKTIDWKLIAQIPKPAPVPVPQPKDVHFGKTVDDHNASKGQTIDDTNFQFAPLYWLEVWQNGEKQNEFPILKNEIIVGRDDADVKETNIRLQTENMKISSRHTKISCSENGEIVVTGLKKMNPTILANKPLIDGQSAVLVKGDTIQIYEFTLQLRFAE